MADEVQLRHWARWLTRLYVALHPEYKSVLTAGERSEQYADFYARTVMCLIA